MADSGSVGQPSRGFLIYLLVTAFLCGGLIMMVEVLGARVIGPFFGVSLFVWTALITVTLVALAAGYAAGGQLADRHDSPDWLYGIILLSGVLVVLIPWLKAPVLKLVAPLGLRGGAMAGALLLFGPALFLLGCVSPYLVRLTAREMRSLGRTVGGLYALSTVGSFVGTVATGYFLIAWLGVNRIFLLAGLALIGLAVVHFVFFRRAWQATAALLLPFLLLPADELPAKTLANGTHTRMVHRADSHYGNLRVIEYRGGAMATRELAIDGLIQGGIDLADGRSVYEYPYLLKYLPTLLGPDEGSALFVGLGAGVVPRWYEERGYRVDVVDIDPEVVRLARQYFGFVGRGGVYVEDARHHLANSRQRYDLVVHDVFNGDTTPAHLLSIEAVRLAKARLNPGGILALNLIGSADGRSFVTASVVRTLRAAFDQVWLYPLVPAGEPYGNLVLLAYDGPARSLDLNVAQALPVHPLAADLVRAGLAAGFSPPAVEGAMVLSDDYNPVDFFDLDLKESVRRAIIESTDWDMLLS